MIKSTCIGEWKTCGFWWETSSLGTEYKVSSHTFL